MRQFDELERTRRRRFFFTGFALLSLGTAAAALPEVTDWWEGWSASEEVLDDGTKHLIVTDPEGNVDFDEILQPQESVFMTEDLDYFILDGPDEGEDVERIVSEILGESRD